MNTFKINNIMQADIIVIEENVIIDLYTFTIT